MSGILFGSISTLADTSELQRQAFNDAFAVHGLGWRWDRDDYVEMLTQNGGEQRITEYAATLGESVDAGTVHQTKSELFQESLAMSSIAPRAGVVDTIHEAKSNDLKVALVTTTSPQNVSALLSALGSTLQPSDFDLIVDASSVQQPKPDKAAYSFALEALGETAADCVAIEDNIGGVQSAVAAGLRCVAFPNENTSGHRFDEASGVVDRLDLDELRRLVTPSSLVTYAGPSARPRTPFMSKPTSGSTTACGTSMASSRSGTPRSPTATAGSGAA